MAASEYDRIIGQMIEAMGHTTQSFGVGRTLGQIFAFLYFSREPRSLDEVTAALGISKGSASMGVRQLEQWEAVQQVQGNENRKDYYVATDAFGRMIRKAISDLSSKNLEDTARIIGEMRAQLNAKAAKDGQLTKDDVFVSERIDRVQAFQKKTREIWDSALLQMLLK